MADAPPPVPVVNSDTISTVIRYLAKTAAGAAVAHGLINANMSETVISAIVSVGALVWGIYSANQSAKAKAA